MTDEERRALLEAVAAGGVSPEDAARLLSEPAPEPTQRFDEPAPTAVAPGPARRVRIEASAGSVRVIGDPEVVGVKVDGEHELEEQGDTLVVRCSPIVDLGDLADRWGQRDPGDRHERGGRFEIRTDHMARSFRLGSVAAIRPRLHVTVRMNPDLPLAAHLAAGSIDVRGVHAPIDLDVDAGAARLRDVRSPLNANVRAGALTVDGRFDAGDSRVHCDMGSATIRLDRASDVRVKASVDLGRCDVQLDDDFDDEAPRRSRGGEWVVGDGTGSLVVHGSLSSVSVTMDS